MPSNRGRLCRSPHRRLAPGGVAGVAIEKCQTEIGRGFRACRQERRSHFSASSSISNFQLRTTRARGAEAPDLLPISGRLRGFA